MGEGFSFEQSLFGSFECLLTFSRSPTTIFMTQQFVQRFQQGSDVWNEPPVIIKQAEERTQLADIFGLWSIHYGFNLGWGHM